MEKWKDIVGYEGFYQVSNKGNIKSLNRSEKTRNRWGEFTRTRKEFIMKLNQYPGGHLGVELNKNKKIKRVSIHRLVYQAFIGELKNEMCIHHIDFNKKNNCVDNLIQLTYNEHNNIHKHEPWNKGKTWDKKTIKKIQESRRKTFSKEEKKVYDLKVQGFTNKEIAIKLNVCTRTVSDRLQRYKESKEK